MLHNETPFLLGCSAASAIAVHLVSQRFEPTALTAVPLILMSTIALPIYLYQSWHLSLMSACTHAILAEATFLTTLFTSMCVYRLFISPLRAFPGPFAAKISKIWFASVCSEGYSHLKIDELHKKHGDVVRIGPNELSINDPKAIEQILTRSKMSKGPWYKGAFSSKGESLHAIRQLGPHAVRRKYWDRSFSAKAVNDYAHFVIEHGNKFIARLKEAANAPVDISEYCSFLVFDTMGMLSFDRSFDMLESKKQHFYLPFIESAMKVVVVVAEIPWILDLLFALPVAKDQQDVMDFSMSTTKQRIERGTRGRADIFSYLMGEDQEASKADLTLGEKDAEVRLAIIAGSDTSASALTFALDFLLLDPSAMRKLQDEVEPHRHNFDHSGLADLPYLNAVINETLRMRPAVANRSQRIVSRDEVIAGKLIPAGTHVSVPFYASQRDPRNFAPDPDTWRPERWIDPKNETALNKAAFLAFSSGPFSCAGKNLALLELRVFLTMFALNFNGKIASGFDHADFERSIKERFTVQKGKLMIELEARDNK